MKKVHIFQFPAGTLTHICIASDLLECKTVEELQTRVTGTLSRQGTKEYIWLFRNSTQILNSADYKPIT